VEGGDGAGEVGAEQIAAADAAECGEGEDGFCGGSAQGVSSDGWIVLRGMNDSCSCCLGVTTTKQYVAKANMERACSGRYIFLY